MRYTFVKPYAKFSVNLPISYTWHPMIYNLVAPNT